MLSKFRYQGLYFLHKIYAVWLQFYSVKPKNGKLALHVMFKDEAPFLKEWLDFHFAHGVDFIRLTNDDSADGFKEILEPYLKRDLVEWEDSISNSDFYKREEFHKNKALKELGSEYQWIAFIDSDEFIFPLPGENLKKHLPKQLKTGGIVLNWLIYGTAHVEELFEKDFLIERLNRRFPDLHEENYNIKTIVQSGWGAHFFNKNPHFPLYSPLAPLLWSDKETFRPDKRRILVFPLHIKHYWYRTEKFFRETKRSRRIYFEGAERREILERWHHERSNAVFDPINKKYKEEVIYWREKRKL
jgi:hypothetical protein